MDILERLRKCDWKEFEQITKEILELHNYAAFWNVNLTIEGRRRQYDVIAVKGNKTIIIDNKKWDSRRSRVSALKLAVKRHKERCQFYELLFGRKTIPAIVTFNDEPVLEYEDVFIVPLSKLNDFLIKI